MSEFMLGSSLGTLTPLSELLPEPVKVPNVQPRRYQEMIELDDFHLRGMGPPSITWIFPLLEEITIRNELKEICPGASADVYIMTLLDDGDWHTYQAVMRWPEVENQENYWPQDLRIEFILLQEIVE